MIAINIGFIIWKKEMPDALRAVNSDFSDKFPIIIIDDNNMAKGSAVGTNVELA